MATAKFFLDTRAGKGDAFPLKIRITHRQKNVAVNLGVKCRTDQWDEAAERFTGKMPNWKALTNEVTRAMVEVRDLIREMTASRKIGLMTAADIKAAYEKRAGEVFSESTFVKYYKEYVERVENARTRTCYEGTLKKVEEFGGNVMFEDLTRRWLGEFEGWLRAKGLAVNSRSIHLRNVRAVLYAAMDDEVTAIPNPFRKFKVKSRKESATYPLTVEQMRALMEFECGREAVMIARDVFMASFYLMGINMADLYALKRGERCRYERRKTHKMYDAAIQPEAAELARRYEDGERMFNWWRRYATLGNFTRQVNKNLKVVGKAIGVEGLHTYHARHTWATMARGLGVPKDVIAECLGHSSGDVTEIYARFDTRARDKANRAVIDYLKGEGGIPT